MMKVKDSVKRLGNGGKILIFLLMLGIGLMSVSCRRPVPRATVPGCPSPHKIIEIIRIDYKGKLTPAIVGDQIDRLIENHLVDHECIDRLKALLGEKK